MFCVCSTKRIGNLIWFPSRRLHSPLSSFTGRSVLLLMAVQCTRNSAPTLFHGLIYLYLQYMLAFPLFCELCLTLFGFFPSPKMQAHHRTVI